MVLKEIFIESYRSINNQSILLDYNCKGFIGLNESGKSNILNAIRGLDYNFKYSLKDRSKIDGKLPKIVYKFIFEEGDIDVIKKSLQRQLKPLLVSNNELIFKKLSIDSLSIEASLIVENNEPKMQRLQIFESDIAYNKDYVFLPENSGLPANTEIKINEKSIILNSFNLIDKKNLNEELLQYFVTLEEEAFKNKVNLLLKSAIIQIIPTVIFWEYDNKYLLPSEITYLDLMKDDSPYDNSAPLYNMLLLSERLEILDEEVLESKISQWKIDTSLRRKDASILTYDINKYIKSIWEDYDQKLSIELEENKITIHINDPDSTQNNYYEMEARSQGFKTFISFILTIGAEFENQTLDNFILLLDEPETHLHPSGVRFMKNELFKLADNANYIFYATHSIFMIDRKILQRHYIVTKDNEITKIKPVDRNNITQEAVIYEALGTTIDEFSISSKNLMFEGDTDLLIFEYFIKNCLAKKNNELLDYWLLNGGGTRKIDDFFLHKIMPKDSTWILILDNDNPGQKLKEKIDKLDADKNFCIKSYFYSKIQNFELEDILPRDLVIKSISDSFKNLGIDINFTIDENDSRAFSAIVGESIGRNQLNKNDIEDKFKENLKINVEKVLKEISKEKTIPKRFNSFCDHFHLYYAFLENFLKENNITTGLDD